MMDHVVYLDAKAKEMEKLLQGNKTMIVRGAAGRKLPYGRVSMGDVLYLLENDGTGLIRAKAEVKQVFNSEIMDRDQSAALIDEHQDRLQLTPTQTKRWAGKRYLVLIALSNPESIKPFPIDKSEYGNMDDWLPVDDINSVK